MTASTAKKIAIALTAIASILVLVPFEPSFPGHHLDWSWAYAMNVAVAKGLQFGRDIVFTYGPLASVSTGLYHPATDFGTMLGRLILAAAVIMVFWGSCDRRYLFWLLALPLVLSQHYGLDPIFIMLPPMFLLFCVRNSFGEPARTVTVVLAAAAFGLMPLIKGSFTPAVAICGFATLLILWRQSRGLVLGAIAVFGAVLISGWLLRGQSLGGLLNYFIAQQPIISGYSDAMAFNGPMVEVAIYISAAMVLLLAIWRSEVRVPWFAFGAIALALFMAFKAGFVRHDGHAMAAGFAVLLLSFFVAVWVPGRLSFSALVVAAASHIFIVSNYVETSPSMLAGRFTDSIAASIRGIKARLSNSGEFDEKLEAANGQIRAAIPLPDTKGSADAYPIDLAALFGNHIDWKPRPILQSYSAYTPKLVELNDAHLKKDGPDRVFFRTSAIDGRFPNIEDGPSWLTLLEKYRPTGFSGEFAVLDRQANSTRVSEISIKSLEPQLGENISLIGIDGPIFARIEMSPTIMGKLLNLAFKSPELRIELTYANGEKADYRYVAGMGATGFVLSPTVNTKEQFVALRSTMREEYFGGSVPVSFRIYEANFPGIAWRPTLRVKLSRLSIPGDESADALLYATSTRVLPSLDGFMKTPDCVVDRANNLGAGTAVVPRNGGVLNLSGWGMVSGKDGVQSDNFALALVDANGRALVYPLKTVARPDVGAHFGHPAAVMVGFEGALNIKQVVGARDARVLLARGAERYICEGGFQLAAGPSK